MLYTSSYTVYFFILPRNHTRKLGAQFCWQRYLDFSFQPLVAIIITVLNANVFPHALFQGKDQQAEKARQESADKARNRRRKSSLLQARRNRSHWSLLVAFPRWRITLCFCLVRKKGKYNLVPCFVFLKY